MKKTLLLLSLLFFLSGGLLFSQQFSPGISSLESDSSFGIFWNVLDYVSQPTAKFGEYENDYLFGGLSNLNKQALTIDTFNAAAGDPYWAGFYKAGDMPWSVFAGLYHDGGSSLSDQTDYTYGADVFDTDTYTWTTSKTEIEYDNRMFDQLQDKTQFLIDIGDGMITGLYVNLDLIDNSVVANNYTETETVYYDPDGNDVDTTARVNPAVDYTRTAEETELATDKTYNFGIPFFMEDGDLEHSVRLGLGFNSVDNSTTFSEEYTAFKNTISALETDTLSNDVIDKNFDTTIDLNYSLTMPALFGGEDNNLYLSSNVDYVIHSGEYSVELHEKDYDMPGDGTKTLIGETIIIEERTLSGYADFNISLGASHSFRYEVGDGYNFGFMPGFTLGYDLTPTSPLALEKIVYTNKVDTTGDGTYDAIDQVITEEYSNTDDTFGGKTTNSTFTVSFSCPVAFQAQPEDWFMGLTLGSRPQISYASTVTKTAAGSYKTTTEDNLGGTTDTVEDNTANSDTKSVTHAWNVQADYNMGVFFDLSENVRFDVDVSGALASGIWDFTNLTVQAIVAIP